jgi:hypothetical protein
VAVQWLCAAKSSGRFSKKFYFAVPAYLVHSLPINIISHMPWPSISTQRKKASVTWARSFHYSNRSRVLDTENNDTTTPEASLCSDVEIIDDNMIWSNNNGEINALEGNNEKEQCSLVVDREDQSQDLDAAGDTQGEDGYDEDDVLSELEGEELQESLRKEMETELQVVEQNKVDIAPDLGSTAYDILMRDIPGGQWKAAESNQHLGYNGNAKRTKWRHRQEAREAEEMNKVLRGT